MLFARSVLASILAAMAAAVPVANPPKIDFSVVSGSKSKAYSSSRKALRSKSLLSTAGVSLSLENEYSLYLAEITIGTPPQTIQVDVDTGSSDLWVPGNGTSSTGGTYDHSASSTYKYDRSGFSITYGDESSASGDWAFETVNIGGSDVTDLEFGDATTQDVGQAILGVGFKGNEASASASDSFTYDNLPLQLKNQGIISTASYSLFLNSLNATSGSILFGATDSSKYSGDLKTLDVVDVNDSGIPTSEAVAFFVDLDSITANSITYVSVPFPALLDSGTTLIYAPPTVYHKLGLKYGTLDTSVGGYTLDCDTTGDEFSFKFDDKTITVPFSNLIYDYDDSSNTCLFSVLNSDSDYYILGDAFLRSAYVYYDIDNAQVGIAQAKYD